VGENPHRTLGRHDLGDRSQPNPNKTFANYEMLNGISCVNDSNCNAVGSYLTPAFVRLVEHWNGSSWSIVPT